MMKEILPLEDFDKASLIVLSLELQELVPFQAAEIQKLKEQSAKKQPQ